MTKKSILYAPNIHTGGGLILLISVLENWPDNLQLFAFLDRRAVNKLTLPPLAQVMWVRNNLFSRIYSEFIVWSKSKKDDIYFSLNGLPPIFPNKAIVVVFIQNKILLGGVPLEAFELKTKIRLFIEMSISRLFQYRVNTYIVQTGTMKNDLTSWIKKSLFYAKKPHKIEVLPFIKKIEFEISEIKSKKYDFIFVADSLPHKNHRLLLEAWELISMEGLFPILALTLDPKLSPPSLIEEISRLNNLGVKVINLGALTRDGLIKSYLESGALIYPSLAESFGMPLIEASQLQIPIIASELDYVYDVCSPTLTFDPNSVNSLVRAIKKFLNFDLPVRKILTPSEFLRIVYE